MNRWNTFTFRVSLEERRAITNLATHLQRSRSDAVRFVVIEAVKKFTLADSAQIITQSGDDLEKSKEKISVAH